METLLDVIQVSFNYISEIIDLPVIKNVSFSARRGDFISIVGPSGCGKSTLLDLISGLIKPASGKILYKGRLVSEPGREIGYMLQKDHLFEWRTVFRNVMLGPEITGSIREKNEYAHELLDKYQLGDFASRKPSELSGGMRQRAALIRTLISGPELLLLDEPFSALDYRTRLMVCNDIWKIINDTRKTAVMVTHDLAEAVSTGNRVFIMSERPSAIKSEFRFDRDFALKSPLERRNSPEFNMYFQNLWEVFGNESQQL